MTIFQVYAPTGAADPEEIKCFLPELQTLIDKVPGQEILIIMSDQNTKVGGTSEAETTGSFGFEERNETGTRLINFSIKTLNL